MVVLRRPFWNSLSPGLFCPSGPAARGLTTTLVAASDAPLAGLLSLLAGTDDSVEESGATLGLAVDPPHPMVFKAALTVRAPTFAAALTV